MMRRSQRGSPRLPSRSVLNTSHQFKLAEGCNEVIVGSLVIRQLHVSRPDHHHRVRPGFLSCFSLCSDKSMSEYVNIQNVISWNLTGKKNASRFFWYAVPTELKRHWASIKGLVIWSIIFIYFFHFQPIPSQYSSD